MSIILVRHGETALNASRVIQPADTPLSERGHRQAQALAQRLAPLAPAAILSSDLPRAVQTAEPIAARARLPMRTSPLLQERNFGELRGRSYDSLGFDPLASDDAPPGGESVAQFRLRVAEAFVGVLELRAQLDGLLVVVTHGLVIRTMLELHTRLPDGESLPGSLANTSCTIVDPAEPYAVSLLNCVRHLDDDALGDDAGLSGF